MNIQTSSFKRLAIGARFAVAGSNFRKASGRSAYRLKASGRGETHARVPFARSINVVALS